MRRILLLFLLVGCTASPKKPVEGTPSAPPPSPEQILGQIYETKAVSLAAAAPPWLKPDAPMPVAEGTTKLKAIADTLGLAANDKQSPTLVALLVFLLDVEVAAEQGGCDETCMDVRIQAQRTLQSWELLTQTMGASFVFRGLDSNESIKAFSDAQRKGLMTLIETALANSKQNWRRLVVERIRMKETGNELRADLLSDLAVDQIDAGHFDRADGLYAYAKEKSEAAEKRAVLDYRLAANCYRRLAAGCDARMKRADSAAKTEAVRKAREAAVVTKRAATAVKRLRNETEPSALLQRARHLTQLSRFEDARKILETLRAKDRKDARPLVAIAEIMLQRGFHLREAWKLLTSKDQLHHRELEYYEIVVGGWFEAMKNTGFEPAAVQQQLPSFRANIDEYAKLAPDKGRTLQYAMRIAEVALERRASSGPKSDKALRATMDAVISELSSQSTPTPYLRRLQLVLARFDRNRPRAVSVVGPKPRIPKLAELHTYLRFSQALVYKTGRDELLADLEKRSDFRARDLRSALLAVKAHHTGAKKLWREVEHLTDELLKEAKDTETSVRLANNLAVARFRLGKVAEAGIPLGLAIEAQSKPSVANLNMLIMSDNALPKQFSDLVAAKLETGMVQARLWELRRSSNRLPRPVEVKSMAKSADSILYEQSHGHEGLVVQRSFQIRLGYSTKEGLALELDLTGQPWLVLPALDPSVR